jgi:hypothetical protein
MLLSRVKSEKSGKTRKPPVVKEIQVFGFGLNPSLKEPNVTRAIKKPPTANNKPRTLAYF